MAPGPELDLARLRVRARAAYERGRLRAAIRGAWPVAALALLCLLADAPWTVVLPIATLHAVVVIALVHRGRAPARAVAGGWLAGSLPLLVALASCKVPHACAGGSCSAFCLPACLASAAVGAIALVGHARRRRLDDPASLLAAAVIAGLTACMGCVTIGLASAIAALGGIALVTAPAVLVGARR
ncbi:MAG: hypothetical protein K1X88_28465 [Nannocystaceae bacterium]|nr:hypothetical protein [Nannocystaceae bacterium]